MEALALEAITVDKVSCGEQQVEVGHKYEGERSNSGYDEGKFWRNTRSYMSYQLSNKNLEGQFLSITVLDDLNLDNVKITINDKPAEIISAENKTIKISVVDKEVVNVKIASTNERPTPRFYELRILKE